MLASRVGLLFAAIAGATAADAGGGAFGGAFAAFAPEIRPFRVAAYGGVDLEPRASDADGSYERAVYRAGVRVQAWRDADDEVVASASWAGSRASSDLRLPDLDAFPTRLDETRVGLMARRVDARRDVYGAQASLGSASASPFSSGDELTYTASVFARWQRERDAWLFSVFATDDATVLNNVPIPSAIYEWKPRPSLTALLGFPFCSVDWRPSATARVEAAASIFATIHAAVSDAPAPAAPWLRARLAFDWSAETWKWPDELPSDRRVYLRSMRATLGLAAERGPLLGCSLYGGYAFRRELLVGRSIARVDERIDLPSGAIVGAAARIGF